jgi:hypothetical protein
LENRLTGIIITAMVHEKFNAKAWCTHGGDSRKDVAASGGSKRAAGDAGSIGGFAEANEPGLRAQASTTSFVTVITHCTESRVKWAIQEKQELVGNLHSKQYIRKFWPPNIAAIDPCI